jgi:hypothetical protein
MELNFDKMKKHLRQESIPDASYDWENMEQDILRRVRDIEELDKLHEQNKKYKWMNTLLLLLLLVFTIGGGAFYYFNEYSNESNNVTHKEVASSQNTKSPSESNNILPKNKTNSVVNDEEKENALVNESVKVEAVSQNKFSIETYNSNNKIKDHREKVDIEDKNAISEAKGKTNSLTNSFSNSNLSELSNDEVNLESRVQPQTSGQIKSSELMDSSDSDDAPVSHSGSPLQSSPMVAVGLPESIVGNVVKNNHHKAIENINQVESKPLEYKRLLDKNIAYAVIPPYIQPLENAKLGMYLDLGYGINFHKKMIVAHAPVYGRNAHARIGMGINKWSIESGLDYINRVERFDFSKELEVPVSNALTHVTINYITQDTTRLYGDGIGKSIRTVRHYNHYKSIAIPLIVRYQIWGHKNMSMSVGAGLRFDRMFYQGGKYEFSGDVRAFDNSSGLLKMGWNTQFLGEMAFRYQLTRCIYLSSRFNGSLYQTPFILSDSKPAPSWLMSGSISAGYQF